MEIRDLRPDEIPFYPTFVLPATKVADAGQIAAFTKRMDKRMKRLLKKTSDFYERLFFGNGGLYTKENENTQYFHDTKAYLDKEYVSTFLIHNKKNKKDRFGIRGDYLFHVTIFSDVALNKTVEEMNRTEDKGLRGSGLTYYYFEWGSEHITKLVFAPAVIKDTRKSLVEKNEAFQLFRSEITVEDLNALDSLMRQLVRKMKITDKTRYLS